MKKSVIFRNEAERLKAISGLPGFRYTGSSDRLLEIRNGKEIREQKAHFTDEPEPAAPDPPSIDPRVQTALDALDSRVTALEPMKTPGEPGAAGVGGGL